ncbi:DnaD domain protein [Ileibacterium valens]|uniref:Uncharacterized protein n=1 Tax=Ileibacterium valens TaxID=1862668 RepID=A0A1U7NFU7_9FIRM|nr:DnaD domain protein [Ileibacterium valens]OLU36167.1 hypothetical protein BM735_12760 [Erysipelotrichaceae bacterium NYU-BL-F16]OLU39440.1 hypothetical protein BO222_06635 [Ileibacterium valens]OLU39504.1 hypothetical protein BO224_07170 [Erysipelotrichaceae bacterium NYU-BL-E8]
MSEMGTFSANMQPEQTKVSCVLKMSDGLSSKSLGYLSLLYRPLIKVRPYLLYTVLVSLAELRENYRMEDLLNYTGMNIGLFTQCRKELERFSLMATYANEDETELLMYIIPPKSPRDFLRHDIFGRLFVSEMNSSYVQKIKSLYSLDYSVKDLTNISEKIQTERLDSHWTMEKEMAMQKQKPERLDFSYPFNWQIFFRGADRTLPSRLRTDANKEKIAMLANIYGIKEEDMRRLASRYTNENKTGFNFDQMENDLKYSRKRNPQLDEVARKSPYQLPPISYYERLQKNGSEAMPDEKDFIRKLCEQFAFSNEVMNTLLDYCLQNCEMKFIPKIIRREANVWARNNISTREQALAFINNQGLFKEINKNSKSKNSQPLKADGSTLPDWYKETASQEQVPASEELVARLKELQAKFKK